MNCNLPHPSFLHCLLLNPHYLLSIPSIHTWASLKCVCKPWMHYTVVMWHFGLQATKAALHCCHQKYWTSSKEGVVYPCPWVHQPQLNWIGTLAYLYSKFLFCIFISIVYLSLGHLFSFHVYKFVSLPCLVSLEQFFFLPKSHKNPTCFCPVYHHFWHSFSSLWLHEIVFCLCTPLYRPFFHVNMNLLHIHSISNVSFYASKIVRIYG